MIHRVRSYLYTPGLGPAIVKAVLGSAGLRIAGMFFGFLVGVQLARGLGAEGYGIYGMAMSIVALLTVPAEFGLPQLLTREVAAAQIDADWGRLRGILKWSNKTVLLISAGIAFAIMSWFSASGKDWNTVWPATVLAGLVMVPLVALGNLRSAALRGLQHIVKGQLPGTLVRPASYSLLLLAVSLLNVQLQPSLAMLLGATSAATALVLSIFLLRRNLPQDVHDALSVARPAYWWTSALPMALTEGMRVLQGHLAILLLGLMATLPIVGSFRVASSTALLVAVPVALLNVVGAPIIARLHTQGDKARLQRLVSSIALGMFGSTFLLSLPFIMLGATLLSLVFGEEFADANSVLLVLCAGTVLSSFYGASAQVLNMTGYQSHVTRASAASLLLLAVIAPLSIYVLGGVGAAVATATSIVTWNYLMWSDAKRLLGVDTSFMPLFKR